MSVRDLWTAVAAAWMLSLPLAGAATAQSRPPDIVVFIADDHSVLDSSVYGSTDIRTPSMDRLSRAGLTFDRAFVASPSCAPSRAAFLTGLMPARNGAEANHSKPRPDIRTLPAYLQALGYEVVAFGKVAHYKYTADYGFDHFAHDTFHDDVAIANGIAWLRQRKPGKPLCILFGTNWPHVPWPEAGADARPSPRVPATHVDTPETREMRAQYYAAVGRMDSELGQAYDAAREVLGPNTFFLFSADNGAQWPFAKWTLYDAGIRTPMIAVWPGRIAAGGRTDAMVSWVDLLPTLIEVAGGQAPPGLDGRSFAGVLLGRTTTHRGRIFTTHTSDPPMNVYPIRSVRTADWKYIRNLQPERTFTTHIDRGKPVDGAGYFASWRKKAATDPAAAAVVARYHQRPAEELYDLRADPEERRNLAGDPRHASRLRTLRAELDAWMTASGDAGRVPGEP
ncbi:heparan N-sulfatase [Luteitalea sp. TBR-22]|uniref:sulfatase family protein n=1 Tax=Luteitalea sp. TBR-22 TaxID=2802971 RepID=UPI001AF4412E|nr:sulfatase [Luteitalea sp. TBR-22]BCS32609.1 heparan N-sulfatase [Luteitalea sp. TBR-22]